MSEKDERRIRDLEETIKAAVKRLRSAALQCRQHREMRPAGELSAGADILEDALARKEL